MDVIKASAPSNIALIKYMGKTDAAVNRPTNASLSYTLENLRTHVTLEPTEGADRWEALSGYRPISLSETGRTKFLAHFARMKTELGIEGAFVIRSANTFPSDCGLASSASSFAALTLAAAELARAQGKSVPDVATLSSLSRRGSGSSCRSFYSPWSLWRGEGGEAADLNLKLAHAVIVVDDVKKDVSSSDAHRRVLTSDLFTGRPARAEARLDRLLGALNAGAWGEAFELCWAEFWDMHALFETSRPSFGYMSPGTLRALARVREVWRSERDGPLVTMDAGANVHLLLRPEQTARAGAWLDGFTALSSWT